MFIFSLCLFLNNTWNTSIKPHRNITWEVSGLLSFPHSERQFLLLDLDFSCVFKVPNCDLQNSDLKCMLNSFLSHLNFVSLSCIFLQRFSDQGNGEGDENQHYQLFLGNNSELKTKPKTHNTVKLPVMQRWQRKPGWEDTVWKLLDMKQISRWTNCQKIK